MSRARKYKLAAAAFGMCVCASLSHAEAGQFLFGAYVFGNVAQFEQTIGHKISVDAHSQVFGAMPKYDVLQDITNGRTPFIEWSSNNGHGGNVLASDILAGKYDQQFASQADAYVGLGATVLLEWQSEMTDNPRNAFFFSGIAQSDWGPTYVSVWQRMHAIFVARGATNVKWVWSPGDTAYVKRWNGLIPCQSYFPGPSYVDWMGMHDYNKFDTPVAYDSNKGFLAFYALAPQWAPGKPLIHSQTGATNATDAQREWIATAQTDLKSEFPLVQGFIWFNANGANPRPGMTKQYTLSGAGLTAFSTMAADSYFQ